MTTETQQPSPNSQLSWVETLQKLGETLAFMAERDRLKFFNQIWYTASDHFTDDQILNSFLKAFNK